MRGTRPDARRETDRETTQGSEETASTQSRDPGDPTGTLHRAVGNQAVQSSARADAPGATVSWGGRSTGPSRSQSLGASESGDADPETLTVSRPTDPAEREADRVTSVVVESTDEGDGKTSEGVAVTVTRSPSTGDRANRPTADAEDVLGSLRGGGEALSPSVRSYFEPRFGADFGDVRVHRGGGADAAARSLDATAFTVGRHVVFRSGEYRPGTDGGRRLLAHELTHVVQQSGGDGESVAMPYRPTSRPNFGAADSQSPDLGGETKWDQSNAEKLPLVESIEVEFDSFDLTGIVEAPDGRRVHQVVPTGQLVATYRDNEAKSNPDHDTNMIIADVTGGKSTAGYTNEGDHTVHRIEGPGYHHRPREVDAADRISLEGEETWRRRHYYKPNLTGQASMNFALFFHGGQAIHQGPLSQGSLACVHVEDRGDMKRLNYHSLEGTTGVKVEYSDFIRDNICCARHIHEGRMVSNPCGDVEESDCEPIDLTP